MSAGYRRSVSMPMPTLRSTSIGPASGFHRIRTAAPGCYRP
jgi:hypothetical protein